MREKQRFVKDIFGRKSKEQSTIGRNKIIVRYSCARNVRYIILCIIIYITIICIYVCVRTTTVKIC